MQQYKQNVKTVLSNKQNKKIGKFTIKKKKTKEEGKPTNLDFFVRSGAT